jgi:hypothetical protein
MKVSNLDELIMNLCCQICNSEELIKQWKERGFVCPELTMGEHVNIEQSFYNTVVEALLRHEAKYGIECPDFFVVNGDNSEWHKRNPRTSPRSIFFSKVVP